MIKHILWIALWLVAGSPLAQTFPAKQVRMIVPSPPGGITDLFARAIGARLAELWSQPVVIENRPGGGQIIGAEAVARAAPDGYTMLVSDSSTFVINPHLYKKLPYDVERDFTPIIVIANVSPVIAVNAQVPANDVRELFALARAKPNALSYGSFGTGTYAHIAMEQFNRIGGVQILHVPYKGSAPAVADVVAGQIQVIIGNVNVFEPHVKSGKLKFLATATPKRLVAYPDLPTANESGAPGFETSSWFGVVGPGRMPDDLAQRLNADLAKVINAPDFKAQFITKNGMEPVVNTPAEFRAQLKTEYARWAQLVKQSGATLD